MKIGILFDSTLCIGCGACYQACKEKNNLPRTTDNYLTDKLSAGTYTVVSNRSNRFIRQMCMHCETPTCASVCPVGALVKTSAGPVVYDEDKCMGCRYCMQACPFGAPTYEWNSALPRVRKCTLCADRVVAGLPTACAAVCPTGATKFGDREALIEEAKARIRANPGKYVDHIYGVEEVGGTSVLLLSDVSFRESGVPNQPEQGTAAAIDLECAPEDPEFGDGRERGDGRNLVDHQSTNRSSARGAGREASR